MKHTPGPWVFNRIQGHEGAPDCICITTKHKIIARYDEIEPADTRLIAAAPELLEACWTALTALEMNHHLVTDQLERSTSICAQSILKKAIAKAEGES